MYKVVVSHGGVVVEAMGVVGGNSDGNGDTNRVVTMLRSCL